MTITEQRTIRLSIYHIKVLEQIQETLGLNFSDTIRHLIAEHERQTRDDKKTGLWLKQLTEKIDRLSYGTRIQIDSENTQNSDQLSRIERDIVLIKKALSIIGESDPRTKALIMDFLMEDHAKN
jgi:hypothetical protein